MSVLKPEVTGKHYQKRKKHINIEISAKHK